MKTFLTIFILLVFSLANYKISGQNKSSSAFNDAVLILDQKTNSPKDIRFKEGNYISLNSFFDEYRNAFSWSNDNEARSFRVLTDKLGQTHLRYKQYYKGIELADVQFILHEKNGLVFHANGQLIHGLDLDVSPSLSEGDALQYALSDINAEAYMWENKKNEAYIKREQNDPDATMFPKGVLMLSARDFDLHKDNFHLVYRFDISSEKPMERYYIDVDAITGEIINKITRIRTGDVQGQGTSFYNGVVSLTVADTAISFSTADRWHVDSWNAYQSGLSWWDADPSLGNQGGYSNDWYEGLDTDQISLSGSDLMLEFYHRYKVEEPGGAPAPYDGWDGMNVRISTDDGSNWQVLHNPVPAYSNSSLYSFGIQHGEGPGIPGWTGELSTWTKESIDLSAYAGQTVRIRFAFASDPGFATDDGGPDLFGWQIDNIIVSNSSATLYSNDGDVNGMTTVNLVKEASFIEGNYRLRQYGRAVEIVTYDAKNGTLRLLSEDFVDADSSFDSENGKVGVSVHWALENTYDYYFNILGRNSFDDNGGRMIAYAHWDNNWFNASWNGSHMKFGDGSLNNTPLVNIYIVSHEMTHGLTYYTADLIYQMEYGALNESFSDIFGEAVEFYTKGVGPDWLSAGELGGFRSLSDPNSVGDPDTYFGNGWAPLNGGDNGGVHTNSSVQNFWFYLLSEGGSGVNDNGYSYSVTALGIDQAEQIAYRNLSTYLTPTSRYFDARLGSIYGAIDLYGDNSQQFQSVVEAWNAVGVLIPALVQTVGVDSDTVNFLAEASITVDTVEVTISNIGIQILEISDIQIVGNDFQLLAVPVFPASLNYDENISVKIVYSPVQQGEQFGTLSISSNDAATPNKTVVLIGEGYTINPAFDRVMYASSGALNGGEILSVNTETGEGTNIGPSSYNDILGLTISPVDKKLHAVRSTPSESEILRINSLQGDSYLYYSLDLPKMVAISFDTSGTLYGALETGEIYSIDLANGTYNSVSTAPIKITAITFEPMTNDLWATVKGGFGESKDMVYKINLLTGDTTSVGETGFNVATNDLAFDENGVLYGIKGSVSQVSDLFTIDINTGEGTIIGPVGLKGLAGLAYAETGVTSVEGRDDKLIPMEFILSQNYPNPFNPSTSIEFSVPVNSNVRLTIYNLLGQEVTTIVNEEISAGNYIVIWNGTDKNGFQVSSGVYLYKMKASGNNGTPFSQTKKMILLK